MWSLKLRTPAEEGTPCRSVVKERGRRVVLILTLVMEMLQRATGSSRWIRSIFILLTVYTLSTSSTAEEVSNNIYSKLKLKPIQISNSDSSEHTHSTDGKLEVSQIKSTQLENPHISETNQTDSMITVIIPVVS